MMLDTGSILSQLHEIIGKPVGAGDASAAQAASHEAGAILDSIQMPHLTTRGNSTSTSATGTVTAPGVPASSCAVSVTSSDESM